MEPTSPLRLVGDAGGIATGGKERAGGHGLVRKDGVGGGTQNVGEGAGGLANNGLGGGGANDGGGGGETASAPSSRTRVPISCLIQPLRPS